MKKGFIVGLLFFSSYVHGNASTVKNIDAGIDLLLWRLSVSGDENWAQEIITTAATQTATALNVPFKWQPGVRVGISKKDFLYTNCSLDFKYTWYQSIASRNVATNSGGIYSAYSSNFYVNNTNGASFGPNYRNASIKWQVLFNTLDLELVQLFKISHYLQLKPFIGIKGASINQYINTTWQNPNPTTFFSITIPQNFTYATENLKNNFYGVGPSLGLYSSYIKSHIETFADFSASFLWGRWSFCDEYKNNNNVHIATNSSNITGMSPVITGGLGIAWNHNLADFLLRIKLAYEAQIWFNQLQYYSFNMGRLNNLLSTQGITLGVRLTFR